MIRQAILISLLLVCAWATHRRVAVWQDSLTLWSDAVEKAPCLIRPHVQLAQALTALHRDTEAQAQWQQIALIELEHRCDGI